MPTSLAEVYLHLVFATKKRTPWLEPKELRIRLYEYLNGICRNLGSPAICIGGVADHVHIALRMSRELSIADMLREMKRSSSVWIRQQPGDTQDFHWQDGYSAFSVSPSHMNALVGYIRTQDEHHRKTSYHDELIEILKKYDVAYDERYLFD
ncbi:MAG TPA: IS200/IS605 family transposase [Planctomycetota bacterium]|jgi:REP element-mobilizing transposase RayT|nr:IS200/IS605 family transposase [Planctomycetota bacterium]